MQRSYTPAELSQLQAELYDILGEIIRVCEAHDIPYFLIGGTAIGALYDQGILPWDDDIDLGMTREAYDRFCQIAPKALRPQYFLAYAETEAHTPFYFAKVRKHGTRFVEQLFAQLPMHHGIYVDIFPFDRLPDQGWLRKLQYAVVSFLKCCLIGKEIWLWRYFGTPQTPHPSRRGPLPCLLNRVVDLLFTKRAIYRMMVAAQSCFNHCRTTHYNNIANLTDVVEASALEALERHPFGPFIVTAPRNLEGFLRSNYPKLHRFTPEEVATLSNHCPAELQFSQEP